MSDSADHNVNHNTHNDIFAYDGHDTGHDTVSHPATGGSSDNKILFSNKVFCEDEAAATATTSTPLNEVIDGTSMHGGATAAAFALTAAPSIDTEGGGVTPFLTLTPTLSTTTTVAWGAGGQAPHPNAHVVLPPLASAPPARLMQAGDGTRTP